MASSLSLTRTPSITSSGLYSAIEGACEHALQVKGGSLTRCFCRAAFAQTNNLDVSTVMIEQCFSISDATTRSEPGVILGAIVHEQRLRVLCDEL